MVGLWESGAFFESVNDTLLRYLPSTEGWPTIIRFLYLSVVSLGAVLCTVGAFTTLSIALFLMLLNPAGKRHWRNVTPSAIVVIVLITFAYTWVLFQRVSIVEAMMLVLPAMTGVLGFTLPMCMRSIEPLAGNSAVKLV